MNWNCKSTWKRAKSNTLWCLAGCSIGDFGTIFYFQNIDHSWNNFEVMGLAIINGLITSIILETIILLKQMDFFFLTKNCSWHVLYIHDWNGNSHEFNRSLTYRWCNANMVGSSHNASCWFLHSSPLQLLETKKV